MNNTYITVLNEIQISKYVLLLEKEIKGIKCVYIFV